MSAPATIPNPGDGQSAVAASAGTEPAASRHAAHPDVKIYSHSPILYWWPVWVVGFVMAFLTWLDGGSLAYAPPGTVIQGNQLVAPAGTTLEAPDGRMAHNPYLGSIFFMTVVIVFVSSNVNLRGVWEAVGVLGIALVVAVISAY